MVNLKAETCQVVQIRKPKQTLIIWDTCRTNLPDVDRVISFHLRQADVSVCSSKGDCVMNGFLNRRLDQLSVVSCSQLAVQLTRSPQFKNVLPIKVHLELKIIAHSAANGGGFFFIRGSLLT